jgi:hypothetical protein
LAIAFIMVMGLARAFPMTQTLPAAVAQIVLSLVCVSGVLIWMWICGHRLSVRLEVLAPALALAPILVAPSLRWGALGSPLDTVLNLLAGLTLGLFTGIRQTAPPPDSGFAREWKWVWREGAADNLGGIVTRAYLPVPVERLDFWNSNRFLDGPGGGKTPLIPQGRRFAWGLTALALGSLFFLKRPWLVVPYWLGSLALLAFFHVKYYAGLRHGGFLYLWFIALLWMSFSYRPWTCPHRWVEWLPAFWDRHRMKALMPLLALQVWGTAIAAKVDWREPFSQAKAVAGWLRTEYPDRTAVVFVGTIFPKISEVFTAHPISIAAPWFNKVLAPLALFGLAGVGRAGRAAPPMAAWCRPPDRSMAT